MKEIEDSEIRFLSGEYWDNRYREGSARWDIGYPSPAIMQYVDRLPNKGISILIPGCGNAHEAAYLLQQGFTNITLIDISRQLVDELKQKFSGVSGISIYCQDFFEHSGQYDLVLEQTFFCALDPELRDKYVEHMHSLLKPGGRVAGLLFNCPFETSPPFGGTKAEYMSLFSKYFKILTMDECKESIEARRGNELWIECEREN